MDFETQEKIMELKREKLIEQSGRCAHCGKYFTHGQAMELAHIVPQRKWILKKYGKEIIHHQMNMKLTHSGECNSGVQISPNKTSLMENHINMIRRKIKDENSFD